MDGGWKPGRIRVGDEESKTLKMSTEREGDCKGIFLCTKESKRVCVHAAD